MPTTSTRKRLIGLDGVRGLAALFVVINHTYLRSFPGYPAITAPWWAGWFIYGRFAVVLFIVLSGFSLAVSPARAGWRLDGNGKFAQRRAWRIVPPYWAALTFSLLVAWFVMPQPGQATPNFRSVWVNGLLLQDVFVAPSPNRAFWTIAIEAQLYFVFPLLILLVRRVSGLAMLVAATSIVVGVGFVVSPYHLTYYAPDFAALFAAGVFAAGVVSASQRRQRLPWQWFAFAAAVPVAALIALRGSVWTLDNLFWVDLAFGPAIACLLAAIATDRPVALVRLLDTAPLRSLGSFSYSLYLTHAPIVAVVCELVVPDRVPLGVPKFLVSLAIALPLTVGFARLFGGFFEIPFQRYRSWAALNAAVRSAIRRPASVAPPTFDHAASVDRLP